MKILILAIIVFASSLNVLGQAQNTAPIIWERYRIARKDLSVMLPKLPTVSGGVDACNKIERSSYFAYAEGLAYEVSIVEKLKKGSPPAWCRSIVNAPKPPTIEQRLDEIRDGRVKPVEAVIDAPGLDVRRFTTDRTVRQVFSDVTNGRWIELAVTHYPDTKPDLEQFLSSLQFTATGKDIDDGAKRTLGDPMDEDSTSTVERYQESKESRNKDVSVGVADKSSTDKTSPTAPADPLPGSSPNIVVAKPRATYTDAARQANVQGAIRLKVTLLKNGAVGKITIVKDLSHGLTDQAIYAARRIVFLPKKVGNVPVNAVVTLEYTFSIY